MPHGLPQAHVAHRIPYRLRVHVPSRKGDRDYFHKASERLRGQPSVRSVRASSITGSITIEHDGHARDLVQLAREIDVFDLPEAALAQAVAGQVTGTVPGLEPSAAVSAGLAAMGIHQAIRGNLLGSGIDHLWQAYGAVRIGSPGVAALMALLGAFQMFRGKALNPAASLFFYVMMLRAGRR
jgi:hypothetical protein